MVNDEGELTDILNETGPKPDLNADPEPKAPEAEPETPEKDVKAEPEAKATGETEKPAEDAEKGDKDAEEPPSSAAEKQDDKPTTVPIAAVHDERRKRQELERRLQVLEHQGNQAKQEPAPDPIEDPEGYQKHQEAVRRQERLQDRIAMSEQIVRSHVGEDEYSSAELAFAEEVKANPALASQMVQSPNPAQFAFDVGKAALERQEIGDPKAYADKKVEEALAKHKEGMAQTIADAVQAELAKRLPQSLADTQSTGVRTTQTPVDDGDQPISELLPS